MTSALEGLEPRSVWDYFFRISRIPHGSGNEAELAATVQEWARLSGCIVETDTVGNVLIRVAATEGMEHCPGIILQAHLDMVCEKNETTAFNFLEDPIRLQIQGEWLTADETTLGADNGIGLAMALSLMTEQNVSHGPLEILCTMTEETGLIGAMQLQKNWLRGDILINTDTEEEGVLIIGCAGGIHTDLLIEVEREPRGSNVMREIRVSGLTGGHSGMEIHLQRGNAIRILARILNDLSKQCEFRISNFRGGDKHNAIPREAVAVLCVDEDQSAEIDAMLRLLVDEQRHRLHLIDPGFFVTISEHTSTIPPLDIASTRTLMDLLLSLPHGVDAMSSFDNATVESSSNLAAASLSHNLFSVYNSSRSANELSLRELSNRISAIGRLTSARISQNSSYPPWTPDYQSSLLAPVSRVFAKLYGKPPTIKTVHAGLECGILQQRYPHLKILSLGPDIEMPHSPNERVRIDSVARTFSFLCRLIEELVTPE